MPTIEFVRNPIQFHDGKATALAPSRRYAAVELEIATIQRDGRWIDHAVDAWSASVVPDGSVKYGWEITTAPASGEKLVGQLRDITAALTDAGARADERCGMHVHVDVRDFSWKDMAKLVVLWGAVECQMEMLVPETRTEGGWCESRRDSIARAFPSPLDPSWGTSAWKSRVVAMAGGHRVNRPVEPRRHVWQTEDEYETEMREYRRDLKAYVEASARGAIPIKGIKGVKPVKGGRPREEAWGGVADGGRYYGLNLQSWWKHGTVECRLHEGTVKFNDACAWAALLTRLVDFAKKSSVEEVNALRELTSADVLDGFKIPAWETHFQARRAKFAR